MKFKSLNEAKERDMEIKVTLDEKLEDCGKSLQVYVEDDPKKEEAFHVYLPKDMNYDARGYTEKEMNQIIAALQKAKKIRKTKQLN
jgi:hypothetical protein